MNTLTGFAIDQFDEITSLNDSSLFLVSERDRFVHDRFRSRHASLPYLANGMLNDIIDNLGFGSILGKMSSEYSLSGHNHDDLYNKAAYSFYEGHPTLGYDPELLSTNFLSIGNIFLDGRISTVYIQLSDNVQVASATVPFTRLEPKVGEIRLVAKSKLNSVADIDIAKPDFDGWLYPRGQSYQLSKFALADEIKQVFPNANGWFTLPNVNGFLQIGTTLQNYTSQNSMPAHSHGMQISLNSSSQASIGVTLPMGIQTEFGDYPSKNLGDGWEADVWWGKNMKSKKQAIGFDENTPYAFRLGDGQDYPKTVMDWLSEKYPKKNRLAGIYSGDAEMKVSSDADLLHLYHYVNLGDVQVNADMQYAIPGITIDQSDATANVESYPTHMLMPVMVYVGQTIRSYST